MAECVLDGNTMNERIDTEILDSSRRTASLKYLALGLCIALFVIYGLVVG